MITHKDKPDPCKKWKYWSYLLYGLIVIIKKYKPNTCKWWKVYFVFSIFIVILILIFYGYLHIGCMKIRITLSTHLLKHKRHTIFDVHLLFHHCTIANNSYSHVYMRWYGFFVFWKCNVYCSFEYVDGMIRQIFFKNTSIHNLLFIYDGDSYVNW